MESRNRSKKAIEGGDIMEKMKSFLIFFYILDQCYDQYMEDDLGGFLGAISPELWRDGQPADKAIYNDWEDSIKIIDTQNIVEITYKFLEFYEQKFGFNLKKQSFF